MASSSQRRFVDWEERFVSHERGCRVVHYLLRDRVGTQWLAVVGTERSLRHMVYVVCDEFLSVAGLDKSTTSGYKWRARREVLDWLSSFLIKSRASDANHSAGSSRNALNSSTDVDSSYSHDADAIESGQEESRRRHHNDVDARRQISSSGSTSDVVWVGPEWTCRKKLKHFHAFQRNGVVISVRRFVYVMTEEKDRHIAHVEDLYEDKKQRKKLRVRWFHKPSELGCRIPPPAPDRREVFFTSYEQDLSVECVDGVATVLTPDHFLQCLGQLGHASMTDTHMCSRQFDSEGIRPFNIQSLSGYLLQPVLSFAGLQLHAPSPPVDDHGSEDMDLDEYEGADAGKVVRRGPRTGPRGSRRRAGVASRSTRSQSGRGTSVSQWTSVQRSGELTARRSGDAAVSGSGSGDWKDPSSSGGNSEDGSSDQLRSTSYQIGDHIEVLSEDSGIRGCWFKGTVVAVAHRRLKVRYDDLLNDSNSGNLEEWISSTRHTAADNERTRSLSVTRPTIRPARDPPNGPVRLYLQKGAFVDTWRGDGWWEGVVKEVTDEMVEVLFPEERDCSSFKWEDLRPAQEWLGNGLWVQLTDWTEIKPKSEARAEESRKFMPFVIRDGTICNDASLKGTSSKARNRICAGNRGGTVGLKSCQPVSNDTSRDDSQVNGSSDSASFDDDEGARILSMISKSGSVHSFPVLRSRQWPIACALKQMTADDAVGSEGTSRRPVTSYEDGLINDQEAGSGERVAVKAPVGKHYKVVVPSIVDVEDPYLADSVKEEPQDVESLRTSSPESSRRSSGQKTIDGGGITSGLKWKRKRHRQGDLVSKGGSLSATNESKDFSLENSRDESSADRRGEDSSSQDNVEKLRRVKPGDSEDLPRFKRHRQGGDSSLKSIHGTSMGGSFLISSMPIANLVMSR